MVKFSVLKDDILITELELSEDDLSSDREFIIGRSSSCDLVISDQKISRNHLTISYMSGIVSIKNISNFDNMFLNGAKVSQAIISETDQVKFYEYELKVSGINEESSSSSNSESLSEGTLIIDQEKILSTKIEELEKPEAKADDKLEEPIFEEFKVNIDPDSEFDFKNNSEEINEDLLESESLDLIEEDSDFPIDNSNSIDDSKTRIVSHFKKYTLTISGPEIQAQKLDMDQEYLLIGRSRKKCHVVLDDKDVSSIHAKVFQHSGSLFVEDLNSANGIYVNGEKVTKSSIIEGDEILIGSISFLVGVKSEMLNQEADILMPVNNLTHKVEEKTAMNLDLEDVAVYEDKSIGKASDILLTFDSLKEKLLNQENKRPLVYGAFTVFIMIAVMWPAGKSDQVKTVATNEKTRIQRDIASPEEQDDSVNYSESDLDTFEQSYKLAKRYMDESKFADAEPILDAISIQYPGYKQVGSMLKEVRSAMEEIEEQKRQELILEEKRRNLEKISEYEVQMDDALKDKQLERAESFLNQAAEIDPSSEKYESMQRVFASTKLSIEKEREEKRNIQEAKNKFREGLNLARKQRSLGEYSRALKEVEKILALSYLENDLSIEGNTFLTELKQEMKSLEDELLSKAREFKRGDDLKNSFEEYEKIMKINPANSEALTELTDLKGLLDNKAQSVFREALVAESISLYEDAKAKYEEVLQLAPSASDYYKKAKDKLGKFYFE